MDKALYDQTINLIEKSQKILLLAHARVDCDGLGAALSASAILKTMGKEVTVATHDPAPENLHFLPSIDILQNSLSGNTDFIISIDTSKIPIGKLKYSKEDHKFNIIITPKEGAINESDISFQHGMSQFDLIFVMDTGNLEHLGGLYEDNVEMFFKTPVINIDHHASNTDFGQVNMVDVNASSTTEVLYEFFDYLEKKLNKKLITEDVATLLLAGIITDTGSFQHANTSPRAMETASKLLDLGARQQEIIKNIYKTKKLSTLKLWGIILSKVQVDPVHRMVWSAISKDDLQEAEATGEETEGVIDDLLTNAPGAEVIFLIKESPAYTSVSMRSTTNAADVGKFCADHDGGGHVRAAGFKIRDGRPFSQAVNDAVNLVRQFQAERLNIHLDNMELDGNEKKEQSKPAIEMPDPAQTPVVDNSSVGTPQKPDEKKVTYLDFQTPAGNARPTPEAPAEEVNEEVDEEDRAIEMDSENLVNDDEPSSDNATPKPKKRRRRRPKKKPSSFVNGIQAPTPNPATSNPLSSQTTKPQAPVAQPTPPPAESSGPSTPPSTPTK